jgi:hypothetical protein
VKCASSPGSGKIKMTAPSMNESNDVRQDRREWFHQMGRWISAAALAGVAGYLVMRKNVSLTNQTCTNKGICRGCSEFGPCNLPAALSAKEALTRRS